MGQGDMTQSTEQENKEALDVASFLSKYADAPSCQATYHLKRLVARVQDLEAARKQGVFRRLTLEEAIRQSLTDDTRCAGAILAADFGATVRTQITFSYEAPANYAKTVLADFIKEKQG
jgi:hypothetical protein